MRTIFEEGWSEIDHQLRYPYDVDNVIISEYLAVFNRLAGNADEMGSFIKRLKAEMENYKTQREAHIREKAKIIQDLESVKKELKSESEARQKLQETIDSLESSKYPYSLTTLWSTSAGLTADLGVISSLSNLSAVPLGLCTCTSCGKQFMPTLTGVVGSDRCPHCGNIQNAGLAADLSVVSSWSNLPAIALCLDNSRTCKSCGKQFTPTLTGVVGSDRCPHCGNL